MMTEMFDGELEKHVSCRDTGCAVRTLWTESYLRVRVNLVGGLTNAAAFAVLNGRTLCSQWQVPATPNVMYPRMSQPATPIDFLTE